MYTLGYNQPNFKAVFNGRGFVSYCHPQERRCTAFWIITTTKQLIQEGKASELLEMNGGLSKDFSADGRNTTLLDIETLDQIAWPIGNYDIPYRMSMTQGYDLARLAVALLNYDTNHAEDDTPTLCTTGERAVIMEMITLVHTTIAQSTLLDELLEPDIPKLTAKSMVRHPCSTRP